MPKKTPKKKNKGQRTVAQINREFIEEYAMNIEEDLMTVDDFDEAIVGVVRRCASTPIVAYDYQKMVEILVRDKGLTPEDAMDHLEYNVVNAYVGELTPCFIDRPIEL